MGLFYIIAVIAITFTINIYMRNNAFQEAEHKAYILMEHMFAVHKYFTHQLRPCLFQYTEKYRSKDYFDPIWMSSSYAIRQMLKHSKIFTDEDYYYYKECALHARSPENEATDYEIEFLNTLKENEQIKLNSELRMINDRPFLVLLRRGTTPKEVCLRCHGNPSDAPKKLIELYGVERSFNQNLQDLIYAISIRIPLEKAYETARHSTIQISGILLILLTLLFMIQHLFFKKYCFTPLSKLQEKATLIASDREHLGEECDIPSGKELENVTIAFNSMSKNLQYHIDNLDNMVKDRTEKLTEINTQLKNEIKERSKAEQETQKNIERYKGIFENTMHGIAVYRSVNEGQDFIFVEFNRGGEKIDGVDRKNIIGKSVLKVFPAVKQFGLFEVFQRVWKTGKSEFFPLGFYQGSHISGWRENYVYKLPTGEIVALYRDETRRKQAEESLYLEKERLYVTLQSIGDGVISTDVNGKVVLINRIAEELTGYEQNEVIGQPVSKVLNVLDKDTLQKIETPINKVLKAGIAVDFDDDMILVTKEGLKKNIADCAAPIFNAQNNIIGAVLVFRDVTEKQKMRIQLQQRQKMEAIGTLAAGIAHDFNNMLGIITGNVSFVLSQINQEEEYICALTDTQAAAKKAISLTHQLLTFSKGGDPIKKPVDIRSFIQDVAEFVTRGTSTKCQFDLSDHLWTVEIDEGQMNQAISNIVINANQAMPDGGVLAIKADNVTVDSRKIMNTSLLPGNYVKITIQDQGIGISEKHLTKIFDPYFTTKQKGSGLGLASSFSIIQKHTGHISVQSQIDEGTCFTIYLPASKSHASHLEKESHSSHTGQGKVLIMDDDEAILKMSGRIFKRLGYETSLATEGSQAIEMYNDAYQSGHPYKMVVLDLTIPGGMGGAKVIPELLKIDPDVKAIVSSGYSNDPVMSNFQQYGFTAVIPKPYTKNQLEEVLNNIV
jgi:PAS domain S-box-containing protein